jgi:hypothetical protein
VQIVDILRDDVYVGVLLQLRECEMCRIRLRIDDTAAALVVKTQHRVRIAPPRFGSGDIFDAVLFPQTIRRAKSFQPAFRADAGTAENDDGFHENQTPPSRFVRGEPIKPPASSPPLLHRRDDRAPAGCKTPAVRTA